MPSGEAQKGKARKKMKKCACCGRIFYVGNWRKDEQDCWSCRREIEKPVSSWVLLPDEFSPMPM